MAKMSSFEARTHFGELLRRAENGESVEITRNGRHVATLTPPKRKAPARDVVTEVLRIREKIRATGARFTTSEILKYRDEGRR